MRCPRDSSELNKGFHHEGVIFSCPTCAGIAIGAEVFDRLDADGTISDLLTRRDLLPSLLACPGCTQRFSRAVVEGHEIDICIRCHFAWLDPIEIQRLLEMEATDPAHVEEIGGSSFVVREFETWLHLR